MQPKIQFGNDTTYAPQKVSVIKRPSETIKLGGLDSIIIVNYQKGISTDPLILTNLGYKAIPTVELSDTNLTYTLSFNDSEKIILSEQFPEVNYEYERVFIGTLVSGDDVDTAKQKIRIADLEKPIVAMLEDITITKDDSLHPSITGYPIITDNNGVKDSSYFYELISSDKTNEVYHAYAEVEDFFGNQAEDSLGNTRIKYQIVKRDLTTGFEDVEDLPIEFSLLQNYPNPFNPSTTIRYSIPVVDANFASTTTTNVVLKIYDILGKEVITLINKPQKAGNYEVQFNAKDHPSGIYFYKLISGNFSDVKKMLLIK